MATQLKEPEPIIEEDTGQDTGDEAAQTQGRDFEAEARVKGWRPQEEYSGKGEWVDAEAFLQRADDNLGLSRAEKEQMRKRISVLEGKLKRLTKLEQQSYESALDTVRSEMKAAVETGDVAAFDALDAKADKIRKDMTPVEAHGEDPGEAFDSFRENNIWYDKGNLASASEVEVEARLMADRLADKFARQGLQNELSPTAFFERIAKEVAEKLPTLGSKGARPKAVEAVAGVTRTAASRSAKTGANLPADAKEAVRRYMRKGIYKGSFEESCNEFAKDYEWSSA